MCSEGKPKCIEEELQNKKLNANKIQSSTDSSFNHHSTRCKFTLNVSTCPHLLNNHLFFFKLFIQHSTPWRINALQLPLEEGGAHSPLIYFIQNYKQELHAYQTTVIEKVNKPKWLTREKYVLKKPILIYPSTYWVTIEQFKRATEEPLWSIKVGTASVWRLAAADLFINFCEHVDDIRRLPITLD